MLAFRFTAGKAFFDYPTHPITVPKTQVSYSELQKKDLDRGDFVMILPRGERLEARMYSNVAGFGPYFQLRTNPGQRIPSYVKLGMKLLVILLKDGRTRYSVLELRG